MPGTITKPKIVPVTTEKVTSGWKVVLYNDDVTPLEVVMLALQRAAGLSLEVAEMVAVEAHRSGEAIVKRGLGIDDAKILCAGLQRWTRIEGICPGVNCEPLPDE